MSTHHSQRRASPAPRPETLGPVTADGRPYPQEVAAWHTRFVTAQKAERAQGEEADTQGVLGTPSIVETHISLLFFVGDRVYKVRKPVHFDFVDFSDRRAREADCIREVELNRRLAPDVYLGVLDIVEHANSSRTPRTLDHAVVMRRLPEQRRLSSLVHQGADCQGCIRSTARVLARFHSGAARSPEIDRAGAPEAITKVWEDNFAETARFVGPLLDATSDRRIQDRVHRYLGGRGMLLERRVEGGWIRDGHGDLQAEDIFCTDAPQIIDCLEFDDLLRYGDVLADLAFLVMDLERLGSGPAAAQLVRDYEEFAGTELPRSLLYHYCASRAYVRTKVTCLRAEQRADAEADQARALHALCESFLKRAEVRLVLVGGLPGTGKSTLAASVADELGAVHLRSDEVRKELAGLPSLAPAGARYREGLYADDMTEATYERLVERAAVALALGSSVVLDASWNTSAARQLAHRVAADTQSELTELRCDVPMEIAAARMRRRQQKGDDPSDATAEVARAMAAEFDPWPTALIADTSRPPADSARAAVALIVRS